MIFTMISFLFLNRRIRRNDTGLVLLINTLLIAPSSVRVSGNWRSATHTYLVHYC
jgi:hypothetical protein